MRVPCVVFTSSYVIIHVHSVNTVFGIHVHTVHIYKHVKELTGRSVEHDCHVWNNKYLDNKLHAFCTCRAHMDAWHIMQIHA